MNVQCLSCSSRYSVPDAKVQGRKVRIKCKRCGDPILIDGTHLGRAQVGVSNRPAALESRAPQARPTPAPPPTHPPAPTHPPVTGKKQTMIGMPSAIRPGREPARAAATEPLRAPKAMHRTLLGGLGAAPAAASQSAPRPLTKQVYEAPPAPAYPPAPWTVAVTEEDQRELTTDQVVALYAVGTIDEGTYVWRDGMEDWCSPFEAPDLRRALEAARLSPREPIDSEDDSDDEDFEHSDEPIVPSSPLAEESAPHRQPGMWHEPGRLGGDPGFEDVTVSMNEKETEGLLRQARRADFDDEPTVARGSTRPHSPFADAAARRPPQVRPSSADAFDFDDEEVTRAISTTEARAPLDRYDIDSQRAFELSQRKSSRPPPDPLAPPPMFDRRVSSAPPVRQSSSGESSVAFSLEALTRKSPGTSRPPPQKARTQIGLGPAASAVQPPRPPARNPPVELAPVVRPASSATPAAAPFTASVQNAASSQPPPRAPSQAPFPTAPSIRASVPAAVDDFEIPDFAKPKRRRWPFVAVLLLVAGAGAASFYLKQPLELWATVHELSGGQFPAWPELRPPPAPETKPAVTATAAQAAVPAEPEPTASAVASDERGAENETDARKVDAEEPSRTKAKRAEPPPRKAAREGAPAPDRDDSEETPNQEESDAEKAPGAADELPEFDRSAAAEALGAAAASASNCKSEDGPTGRGRATVTFANSGRATNADVTGTFAGTSVGGCVAALFRQARVPAFSGPPVKVAKSFSIE